MSKERVIKPKQLIWVTPKGAFYCSKEASISNNCTNQILRYQCNKQLDGFYKVTRYLAELTCTGCGTTYPLDKRLLRSEIKKGKRYFLAECKDCQRKRNNINKESLPFVYRFVDKTGIIYIGKTYQLDRRIKRHFSENPKQWKKGFKGIIEVAEMKSKADMHLMELYLISKYRPKYNQRDNEGDLLSFTLPEPTFKLYKEVR